MKVNRPQRARHLIKLVQQSGEALVARSQAKSVLADIGNSREVVLDFEGVETIGPSFAEEIFRVFGNAHPETKIL